MTVINPGGSIPAPVWTAATLGTGWQNLDTNHEQIGYYQDAFGVVHLTGTTAGTAGTATPIFTLPAGMRPAKSATFATTGGNYIQVKADGTVNSSTAASNSPSLDGMTFLAGA